MAKLDIYSTNWTEIIFENKNKIYGAYDLRKIYAKNVANAYLSSVIFILLLIFSPEIFERISGKKIIFTLRPNDPIILSQIVSKIEIPKMVTMPYSNPQASKTDKIISPQIVERPADDNTDISDISSLIDGNQTDSHLNALSGDTIGTENNLVSDLGSTNWGEGKPPGIVEIMPSFPGGEAALMQYLNLNINYPPVELNNEIQGKVYMTFVVDKEGKITNINSLREVLGGKGLTEEAIRVIASMPKWNPGKQNGKAVDVQFNLPIKFSIGKN